MKFKKALGQWVALAATVLALLTLNGCSSTDGGKEPQVVTPVSVPPWLSAHLSQYQCDMKVWRAPIESGYPPEVIQPALVAGAVYGVKLETPCHCGSGGCTLLILKRDGQQVKEFARFPATRELVVLDSVHHGWRDFRRLTSGGGAPPTVWLYQFDGDQYRVVSQQRELQIATDFAQNSETYQQDGHSLQLTSKTYNVSCQGCTLYQFSFEHYGDPDGHWTLDVLMKQGAAEFYHSSSKSTTP